MKAQPSKIKSWKENPVVKECYEKLHTSISMNETWCSKIISETWSDTKKVSKELIAFTVAVCESFLNPNNEELKNDSKYLSKRTEKNKVSIKNIQNFVISKYSNNIIYINRKKWKKVYNLIQ
jgi:hypothetical protein